MARNYFKNKYGMDLIGDSELENAYMFAGESLQHTVVGNPMVRIDKTSRKMQKVSCTAKEMMQIAKKANNIVTSIHDPVFGDLQYDYSWQKEEDLSFKGQTTKIKVIVEADADQEILDIQRQQYLAYQQKKNEYTNKIPKVLLKYYFDSYDSIATEMEISEATNKENITEQSVTKLIRINDVYFARNGRYGWLCDCAWDEAHGLCILLSNKEPCIREQDYLI